MRFEQVRPRRFASMQQAPTQGARVGLLVVVVCPGCVDTGWVGAGVIGVCVGPVIEMLYPFVSEPKSLSRPR